eukprot:jgi/Chlat1/4252/Chrsp27S04320
MAAATAAAVRVAGVAGMVRAQQDGTRAPAAQPESSPTQHAAGKPAVLAAGREVRWQGYLSATVAVAAAAAAGASPAAAAEAAQAVLECQPNIPLEALAVVFTAVGFIGAGVGGTLARQRKAEVERVNAQLRQINLQLRRQARVEAYAPTLSYAPPPPPQALAQPARETTSGVALADAPVDTELAAMRACLKAGRQALKEEDGREAFRQFNEALPMAQKLGNKVAERRARRGLGAAAMLLKNPRLGIQFELDVLRLSNELDDHTGDSDAYGAIADMYTELNDLENAAKYYDLYIKTMADTDAGFD